MPQNTIFKIEKEQLKYLVEILSVHNMDTILPELRRHVQLLELCSQIDYKETDAPSTGIHDGAVTYQEGGGESGTETSALPEKNGQAGQSGPKTEQLKKEMADDGSWVVDQLKRGLKGGWMDGKLYVPEKIIRLLELEQGDWVKAEFVYSKKYSRNYRYTLLQKCPEKDMGKNASRREVAEYAVVKKDSILNSFIIHIKPAGKDMRIPIQLNAKDASKFRITGGDVIDYAYWTEDVLHGAICWKYETNEDDGDKEDGLQGPFPDAKAKGKPHEKKEMVSKGKREVRPSFTDITIVVVGGRNRNHQRDLQEEVVRREGRFIYCSGKEKKTTLQFRVRKADAVVVFTEYVSHEAMHTAKECCKEHGIPITYTKQLGSQQFIIRIKSLLKNKRREDGDNSVQTTHNVHPLVTDP